MTGKGGKADGTGTGKAAAGMTAPRTEEDKGAKGHPSDKNIPPGATKGKGPEAANKGGGDPSMGASGGPSRTSTPAKTKSGRVPPKKGLSTQVTEFLLKEQQALDRADKDKNKRRSDRVPSETQTKIANYLKKVKESKKEEQDYRRDRSATTPAKPTEVEKEVERDTDKETGRMASSLKSALQEAADATEAARTATAKGLPAMTMVAKQVAKVMQSTLKKPTIPGMSWAEEVEKEQENPKESRVSLEKNKDAEEALKKMQQAREARERYRTYSSSSSTSATRTGTGPGTEDEDFKLVERRRRGNRNREKGTERYRIPRIQILLTAQQKSWYQAGMCLNCGGRHMVHNCRDRKFDKEKASALLRAARKEFPDGAYGVKSGTTGSKRPASERTGITPEAKKGKAASGVTAAAAAGASAAGPFTTAAPVQTKPWFKPVQQTEHTLFIKHKDGSPLTEARFNEIKAAYDRIRVAIGKANMAAKTTAEQQFTPRCSGWNWSPEVARITLKDMDSFRWARTTFGEFQLMDLAQWKASRGRLYCAYLTDRFDPSMMGMSEEDLVVAVWQAKVDLKLSPEDLFQFVRAPRVNRGRLIFISVGEKGEEALQSAGFKIELGSAGDVLLSDNEKFLQYKKEQKAQEQEYRRQKEAIQAAASEQEQDEEVEEDETLTNEASVLVLEDKGEKEKNSTSELPLDAGAGSGRPLCQAEAMEDDDLTALELFMQEEKDKDRAKKAEAMETDGQDEPMQQS